MFLNQVIFSECNSMLKYALGKDLKVPNEIIENIQKSDHGIEATDDSMQQKNPNISE